MEVTEQNTQGTIKVKAKRNNLSIDSRFEILQRLKNGELATSLADEFKVSKSAISTIKKRQATILKAKEILEANDGDGRKKRFRGTEDTPLERAVYAWFLQERNLGHPVTCIDIKKQALEVNKSLGGPDTFKASHSWIDCFKRRHSIKFLDGTGFEKGYVDSAASEEYQMKINNYMKITGINPDYVYNCDETGFYWKLMPNRSHIFQKKAKLGEIKGLKNRVTLMICTNATGTHKLPLYVIGKPENPQCFKDITKMPVIYKHQKDAMMDGNLMMDWYTNVFIPEVIKKHDLSENCAKKKVILTMDNAPCHLTESTLDSAWNGCSVFIQPPNVSVSIQPMNHGIIKQFKKCYRTILASRIFIHSENHFENRLQSLNLLDCCNFSALAWSQVEIPLIKMSWKTLIPMENVRPFTETSDHANTCLTLFAQTSDLKSITMRDVKHWFNIDNSEPGWMQEGVPQPPIIDTTAADDEENYDGNDGLIDNEGLDDIVSFDDHELIDDNVTDDTRTNRLKTALSGLTDFLQWYQTYHNHSKPTLQLFQQCHQLVLNQIVGKDTKFDPEFISL